jgi:hypothetical protein
MFLYSLLPVLIHLSFPSRALQTYFSQSIEKPAVQLAIIMEKAHQAHDILSLSTSE